MHVPFSGPSSSGLAFRERVKRGTFLVVDDFDTMRKVNVNQLKQLGANKIIEAVNGAEALKIVTTQPVTLVLSDWNMPVMTGLELLTAIRGHARLFALPFMMITAEAERERVMQAIQAGVSELLVKPYTVGRFAERVERALSWVPSENKALGPAVAAVVAETPLGSPAAVSPSLAAPAAAATPQVRASSGQARGKPTILVVDDTRDNLELLAAIFKDEYRVKVANNGAKALEISQSDTPPDLILLDIMMPGMDGFQVAQELRSHPASQHIPVIFVTAMADQNARLRGMELGAVDFVTKPVDPYALKVRVRNFMRYVELHLQLQADYDQMMAAERLKEDVERITRHDLKGPLAGVLALVQGMSETENLSESQSEQMRLIEETTLQVLDMINLSNELFKIETGRFTLRPQPVFVVDIVRRIAKLTRRAFAGKDLQIVVATPRGMPDHSLQALGDPMLCYSLFQNLIKNACEAAPEGSRVTITILPGDQRQIKIENQGTVPEAIRETFFEKFATAGKQGGTGLGTYSAKLLTQAQGGTITMETSDETNATRLIVTLPTDPSLGGA